MLYLCNMNLTRYMLAKVLSELELVSPAEVQALSFLIVEMAQDRSLPHDRVADCNGAQWKSRFVAATTHDYNERGQHRL